MGLSHLLNASVLQSLLPFTIEIIVLVLLIVVLAYPVPLTAYFNLTNLEPNPVDNSCSTNKVVNLSTKHGSAAKDFYQNTPCSGVLEVLNHSSSLLESLESRLGNLDKISSNRNHENVNLGNQLKTPFKLEKLDNYIQDGGNEKGFGVVEKTDEEPVPSVDSIHNIYNYSCFYVAPGHTDVSNTRDNHLNLDRLSSSMCAGYEKSCEAGEKTGRGTDLVPESRYTIELKTSKNTNCYDAFDSCGSDSNSPEQNKVDAKNNGSEVKPFLQGSCQNNYDQKLTVSTADVCVPDLGVIKQGEKLESTSNVSAVLSDSNKMRSLCWIDIFTRVREYISGTGVVVSGHCKSTSELPNNKDDDSVEIVHIFSNNFMKLTRVPGKYNLQENEGSSTEAADSRRLIPTDIASQLERILKEALQDIDLLNNIDTNPCNINRPRRSLDSLKEKIDLEDLQNVSNEVLQRNKQIFVEKFINDEIIKNHRRFVRSKRCIPIEEIPILKETENTEVKSNEVDTKNETEDKFVNTKFNVSNNSLEPDFGPCFNCDAVPENERLDFPIKERQLLLERGALSELSKERSGTNGKPKYNSFSNFYDWRRKSDVANFSTHSDAQLYHDLLLKRFETIFNTIYNNTTDLRKSNPFLNDAIINPFRNELKEKGKEDSPNVLCTTNVSNVKISKSRESYSSTGNIGSVVIPKVPQVSFSTSSHEWKGNPLTRNKQIELSKLGIARAQVFGTKQTNFPVKEAVPSISDHKMTKRETPLSFPQGRESCTQEQTNLLRRDVNNMDLAKANTESSNNVYKMSGSSFATNNSLNDNPITKDILSNVCAEKNPDDKSRENEKQTLNDGAKIKSSRVSLLKFRLPCLKTKSQEEVYVEDSRKTQDVDTNKLHHVTSKDEIKSWKTSGSSIRENNDGSEMQVDSQRAGCSKDEPSTNNVASDKNPFFKILRKISRKFKGNPKTSPEELNSEKPCVQNKVYLFKGSQGGQQFPVEDPMVLERKLRSLGQIYSELQCDHHTLKETENKVDIPASGSCTNANSNLHSTTSLEDLDE